MAGRVYVRDLQVLQNLDTELTQFNSGANTVLTDTARDIQSCRQHLQARMGYWQAELRRRQDIYLAAQRQNKKDCRAEAIAVQQAQEAISKLQRLSSRLEQAIGEYQPQANRLQQFLGSKIIKAKGDLRRSIGRYQSYLNQRIGSPGATSSGFSKTNTPYVSPDSIGAFSISDWSGYPDGPKPAGPFRILDGKEYDTTRKDANTVNSAIHKTTPSLKGMDIHEVHPVKFGGSPTDPANKIPLSRLEHAKYTTWWNELLRSRNG